MVLKKTARGAPMTNGIRWIHISQHIFLYVMDKCCTYFHNTIPTVFQLVKNIFYFRPSVIFGQYEDN